MSNGHWPTPPSLDQKLNLMTSSAVIRLSLQHWRRLPDLWRWHCGGFSSTHSRAASVWARRTRTLPPFCTVKSLPLPRASMRLCLLVISWGIAPLHRQHRGRNAESRADGRWFLMSTIYTTKVIFRKDNDGTIVAIFPQTPSTNDGRYCLCYQHVGQHSSCDPAVVYQTKLADPAEYKDLKLELERIGYKLKVRSKITRKDYDIRKSAAETI